MIHMCALKVILLGKYIVYYKMIYKIFLCEPKTYFSIDKVWVFSKKNSIVLFIKKHTTVVCKQEKLNEEN